jgi:putative ABC transport system substrate-binding protein
MRRRDFIKVVAGSATAWPFMARAQERIRLVGLLNILAEDDPESRLRIAAFKKSLQELYWTDGSIRIEARWAGGDVERLRKHAKELVALGPDVILTSGSVTVRPLQQATRTMTRVAVVRDPVNGFRDRPVRRDSSLCAAVRRGVDPYRRT